MAKSSYIIHSGLAFNRNLTIKYLHVRKLKNSEIIIDYRLTFRGHMECITNRSSALKPLKASGQRPSSKLPVLPLPDLSAQRLVTCPDYTGNRIMVEDHLSSNIWLPLQTSCRLRIGSRYMIS
ncbi:hypothetical protein JTB14_025031 [Gonioctena quinquepunctata]|nr:hypothetical protein JTB14_025031 [Gonioctena quinquepunctata]